MSQEAMAKLAKRREQNNMRTGAKPMKIIWTDVTDMGDVKSQRLTIIDSERLVLDYGD